MAATCTLKQIRDRLLQETGLGKVGAVTTGTSSTVFVADSAQFHAPTTGTEWPPGSVVRITSGSAAGSICRVAKFTPDGTFTLTNAMSATPAASDAFVVSRDFETFDRVDEAINRALQNRCSRWQLIPATFVPDGDMIKSGSSAVANWGTTSNATATKQALSFPEVFATQCLQIVTSGTNGYVQGDAISVTQNPTTTGEGWIFLTFLRAGAASSTAQFDIWDVTNNAAATVSWLYPTPTAAKNTTTSREFITIGGTFTIPTNCTQLAPRLTGQESGATVQLGPIILMPQRTTIFPMQPRVLKMRVGNFYFLVSQSAFANPNELFASNNINRAGREVRLVDSGGSLGIAFGGQSSYASPPAVLGPIITSYDYTGLVIGRTVVYDEEIFGDTLSLDADTTTFPLDYVVKWAEYELFERLYQQEPVTYDNYGRPRPNKWEDRLKRAGLKAMQAERDYGAGEIDVAARVGERWV